MGEWQPIETCPRTSKARLVWCPERQNTYIVSWWQSALDPAVMSHWVHFGGGGSQLREHPTHWMPLPEPPQC